jgi:hypothetical protein
MFENVRKENGDGHRKREKINFAERGPFIIDRQTDMYWE